MSGATRGSGRQQSDCLADLSRTSDLHIAFHRLSACLLAHAHLHVFPPFLRSPHPAQTPAVRRRAPQLRLFRRRWSYRWTRPILRRPPTRRCGRPSSTRTSPRLAPPWHSPCAAPTCRLSPLRCLPLSAHCHSGHFAPPICCVSRGRSTGCKKERQKRGCRLVVRANVQLAAVTLPPGRVRVGGCTATERADEPV